MSGPTWIGTARRQHQQQRKTPGFASSTFKKNVYRLVIKELRGLETTMLVSVAYAFSVAVYTVATGASTEARATDHRRRR